jgi:hypothetical protein
MIPVFIGGCPRSGTTLLGAMLGAHRDVICPPEAPFIAARAVLGGSAALSSDAVRQVHRSVQGDYKFRFWGLPDAELNACAGAQVSSYREIIETYVRAFGRRHDRADGRFWIDHCPTNIMYVRRLRDAFADARFVHLLRDGRAVAASILPLDWGPNTIIEAAQMWAGCVAHGLSAEQMLPASQIRRVLYEDLVARPADVLEDVCAFLGLDFRTEMTVPSGLKVPVYTENQHALVGKPVDSTRSDRWRRALTSRQVEIFEALTGDLLANLGYELTCVESRGPSNSEKVTMQVEQRVRQVAHALTLRFRRRHFLGRLERERSALPGQLE